MAKAAGVPALLSPQGKFQPQDSSGRVRHTGPQSGAGLSPGLRRVELLGSRGLDTVAMAVVVAPVSEVRQ